MAAFAQHILRFLLPWACAGCGAALPDLRDPGFCGRCWLALPRIEGFVCGPCGIPLKDGGNLCYGCRTAAPPILIRAAAEYRGVIRPAIHRLKYAGRRTIAQSFGLLLRRAWERYPELHHVRGVIPVPLYPTNERIRGYNQAELLAAQVAKAAHLPLLTLLVRTRKTRSQYDLNRAQRQDNVQAAFMLDPRVQGRVQNFKTCSFLLVDDICTTAATLIACSRALRAAGLRKPCALVLARDL